MKKNIHAAGVFVRKNGLVLAVKRADTGLLGFPAGKIEEDEAASFAAIRECFEETGYVVFVYPPGAYAGIDDTGNVTKVYRAEIVCCEEITSSEKKSYVWVTPNALVNQSLWPEYNKAVFEHFGVDWSR